jgi:biopolymer transport protein ExbD
LSAADGATPVLRDPSTDPEILKESSIVVTIAPDGNLYVGRRLVPEGELEAAVRSLTGGIPEAERVVYLRTHLDAPYGQVVRVIETIRKAGVNQIGLVTEERRR